MVTRSANGGNPLPGNTAEEFAVLNRCSVPQTAQAYALNVTAVPSGPLGYLTIWPGGLSQPVVSNMNSPTGTVVANAAIIAAGSFATVNAADIQGSIMIYVSDAANVVVDINGYFGQ